MVRFLLSNDYKLYPIVNDKQRGHIQALYAVRRMLLQHPHGISDAEMALLLRTTRAHINQLRHELTNVTEVVDGRYTTCPTLEDIDYAQTVLWRAKYDGE